jgi:lysophospholipase L1-like esterase
MNEMYAVMLAAADAKKKYGEGGTGLPAHLSAAALTAASVSLVKAQAMPVSRPRILLIGDSITDQTSLVGGAADPTALTAIIKRYDLIGYYTWAQMRLRHAIICQREAGTTGQNIATMQARFDADIANVAGEIVIIFAGINDIGSDVTTPESMMAGLQDMAERAIASGKRVVLCTLLCNEWNGGAQPDKRTKLNAVNALIRAYTATKINVYLCDWQSAVVDPATGTFYPGMGTDTTHPNPNGAAALGKVLADVLGPVIIKSASDMILTNTDARNVSKNPLMSGTAGTRFTGTGLIADSYTGAQGANSQSVNYTGSITFSKVARTDGYGSWQKVELITPGGVWLFNRITAATLNAEGSTLVESDGSGGYRFKAGTKIRADIEWERDANWTGVTLLKGGINLEGSGQTGYVEDMGNGNIDFSSTVADFPLNGVLRTPFMVMPSGCPQMLVSSRFSATTGTIRFGRMGIVTVP